jgi:hypothetical protein
MMLMRWSPHVHVVAAEVMVMPRSCSWAIQSIVAAPSCTSPICRLKAFSFHVQLFMFNRAAWQVSHAVDEPFEGYSETQHSHTIIRAVGQTVPELR